MSLKESFLKHKQTNNHNAIFLAVKGVSWQIFNQLCIFAMSVVQYM